MVLTIYSELLILIDILLGYVLRYYLVGSLPELQQKYPRAHKCRPQNCFFQCGNFASRWCAVFPFSHCNNRLTVT